MLEVKCKKCKSSSLILVKNGPHIALHCGECLSFIKFIPKNKVSIYQTVYGAKFEQGGDKQ